jgi:hypothetical protein
VAAALPVAVLACVPCGSEAAVLLLCLRLRVSVWLSARVGCCTCVCAARVGGIVWVGSVLQAWVVVLGGWDWARE